MFNCSPPSSFVNVRSRSLMSRLSLQVLNTLININIVNVFKYRFYHHFTSYIYCKTKWRNSNYLWLLLIRKRFQRWRNFEICASVNEFRFWWASRQRRDLGGSVDKWKAELLRGKILKGCFFKHFFDHFRSPINHRA